MRGESKELGKKALGRRIEMARDLDKCHIIIKQCFLAIKLDLMLIDVCNMSNFHYTRDWKRKMTILKSKDSIRARRLPNPMPAFPRKQRKSKRS